MFGTNFPVEKLWTDMPSLVAAWRAAVPEPDHAAVFAGTARRVYDLPEQ
jgi:predicted TIM-barrel fold metal-dependent hydrolase